ncbi:ShlB/FhaC/HecB family hemolysin secretion/activation protein [Halomonas sp. TRM85114]|uniref:ShlB/FhaC/HecB family hemolysin secretion/activation protein n=1 Tax=Halomonas jincaotanensis TaxID=2810616 RepID=UPI001BD32E79|nr:ShlB/FhaC/HecB family hemolysin secretion/activation protein [Halomonas jincaotanensis]MBS9404078.1 ShlB/FhaC/HecB family hemolysin secretion/activation protein [Halomonas jincaotanensis]
MTKAWWTPAWVSGTLLFLISSDLLAQVTPADRQRRVIQTLDPTEQRRGREDPREGRGITLFEVLPTEPTEESVYSTTLTSVVFDGVSVYEESELEALWSELVGQEITEQDAEALADTLMEQYLDDGYMLIFAFADEPDEDGELTIYVTEGYIDSVAFTGDDIDQHPLLITYAEKIMASIPLRTQVFERYFNLMNDLPGLRVDGNLGFPSDPDGAEPLVLDVSYNAVDYLATLDNRGSRFVGRWLTSVGVRQNSALLGSHDQASIRLYSTIPDHEELHAVELAGSHPVGSEGTTLSMGAALSRVRPGAGLKPIDIVSDYREGYVTVEHPSIRSDIQSLWHYATLHYADSESDAFSGELKLLKERVRALRLGTTYSRDDRWGGSNVISGEVSRGLDIMGANAGEPFNTTSRPGGELEFTKLSLYLSRWQPITDDWSLFAALEGQYAYDPLLSSEFISFGGEDSLRAYESGLLFGDHGVTLSLELNYVPPNETALNLQWYGYLETGRAWTRETEFEFSDNNGATATGLGVRFDATSYLSGYVELGWPISPPDAYEGSSGANGYLGIAVRF